MGDFLGSYYTDFLEDEGMSGQMALLKAEQPVSILAMESLIASRRAGDLSSEPDKPNISSNKRFGVIDNLHMRDGKDGDFGCEISRGGSLDGPDLEIPVASMSLFEQDSRMVSVQLRSIREDVFKETSDKERDERHDMLGVRSRSTIEMRGTPVETFSPRAVTTDFDIDPPTYGTEGSFTTKTPRTGDMLLNMGKRTSKLKKSILNFMGRKKKYESTSKRI